MGSSALDYSSDLDFWHSVVKAQPGSAKGHLNYGVMVGARSKNGGVDKQYHPRGYDEGPK